jgi:predicted Zn-dependent protease
MDTLRWIIVLISLLAFSCTEPGAEDLAERYFQPYPDRITTMQTLSDDLLDLMKHYNDADLKQTIAAYEVLAGDFAQTDLIKIYVANAHYKVGNTEESIQLLSSLQLNNSLYRDPIEWYLSLAYIKAGKADKAQSLLERLSTSEGDYALPAKKLLDAFSN